MEVRGISVLYAKLIPGTAHITVVCTTGFYISVRHHGSDHYRNYYEFVLIFAVYGIMIYHDEKFLKFFQVCIEDIQDIVKFNYSLNGIKGFEAMLEIQPKRA
ncbi:hypothetical protein WUBG_18858, partial [Wuchereria bancrofti]